MVVENEEVDGFSCDFVVSPAALAVSPGVSSSAQRTFLKEEVVVSDV